MTTSSGTQALDSVLAKVASDRAQRIVAKLEDLHKRQESIRDTLDKVAAHLDKTNAQQVVEERREKSRAYYAKLKDIRTGMFEIDERTARLQIRLNGIRRDGPQQNALVERGPFHYKCMYRGGVRYRKYPSSTAKVTGAMINFNDVAEVCERVFITGEFSIFLHVKGKYCSPIKRASIVFVAETFMCKVFFDW